MPVSDKPALLPHSTDCIDEFSTMTGSWILAHIYTATCRNLKLCFIMELNPTCSFHPERAKHHISFALQWLNPSLASSHSPGPQHILPMPFQERAGIRPEVYQTQDLVGQVSQSSLEDSWITAALLTIAQG